MIPRSGLVSSRTSDSTIGVNECPVPTVRMESPLEDALATSRWTSVSESTLTTSLGENDSLPTQLVHLPPPIELVVTGPECTQTHRADDRFIDQLSSDSTTLLA